MSRTRIARQVLRPGVVSATIEPKFPDLNKAERLLLGRVVAASAGHHPVLKRFVDAERSGRFAKGAGSTLSRPRIRRPGILAVADSFQRAARREPDLIRAIEPSLRKTPLAARFGALFGRPAHPLHTSILHLQAGASEEEVERSPLPKHLEKGMAAAKKELQRLLAEMKTELSAEYEIQEIHFKASFSIDGKFLGLGPGGAFSLDLVVRPRRAPLRRKKEDPVGVTLVAEAK